MVQVPAAAAGPLSLCVPRARAQAPSLLPQQAAQSRQALKGFDLGAAAFS